MGFSSPTTTRMGISDARAKLTKLVNEVYRGETRIVVEKSGIPVAVMVSPADLTRLQDLDRRREAAWSVVDEVRARFADVSEEELLGQSLESIAAVRAARRAARSSAEATSSGSSATEDVVVGASRA